MLYPYICLWHLAPLFEELNAFCLVEIISHPILWRKNILDHALFYPLFKSEKKMLILTISISISNMDWAAKHFIKIKIKIQRLIHYIIVQAFFTVSHSNLFLVVNFSFTSANCHSDIFSFSGFFLDPSCCHCPIFVNLFAILY
jgi:hypothetical protein